MFNIIVGETVRQIVEKDKKEKEAGKNKTPEGPSLKEVLEQQERMEKMEEAARRKKVKELNKARIEAAKAFLTVER